MGPWGVLSWQSWIASTKSYFWAHHRRSSSCRCRWQSVLSVHSADTSCTASSCAQRHTQSRQRRGPQHRTAPAKVAPPRQLMLGRLNCQSTSDGAQHPPLQLHSLLLGRLLSNSLFSSLEEQWGMGKQVALPTIGKASGGNIQPGAGMAYVSRSGLATPRATQPLTPPAVTPPAVDASSESIDLSQEARRDGAALPLPAADAAVPLEERASSAVMLDPHWGMGRGSDEVLAANVPEGLHHVDWPDGSEYLGEWVGGHPHGRGTYVWPSGVRYDGEWAEGRENGVGTLAAPDGAAYFGFWSKGLMEGQGVYRPATAGNKRAEVIFLRRYDRGLLREETVLRIADYDLLLCKSKVIQGAARAPQRHPQRCQRRDQGSLLLQHIPTMSW
eukprot:jgi/Botrbrau1/13231/Bobra.0199s0004.1